jgi:ABC-type transport system involved in multi-copper enzyme maturation permease subunit
MSTTVATIDATKPGVPLSRLVNVELRKAFNTKAGRWYSFSILILCFIVMIVQAFAFREGNQDLSDFASSMGGTLSFFLPVIPIMLVTSEWSQRTGLVTFTLEPRRSRVVASKFIAGFIVAIAVMALAFVIAALGTAIAGGVRGADVSWVLTFSQVQNFVLANVFGVFIGFAFAMLIMNTPAAIVAYFAYSLILPIVVGIIGFNVGWFESAAPWFEFNTAQAPLFSGDFRPTGEEWAQIATSGTIWLILPLVLGTWRLLRSEVK